MDRPVFRGAGRLPVAGFPSGASSGGGRLRNVHVGLPPSGVSGGRVYAVEGAYDYYHYMQDRFDDDGWGCAYRSLQTIWSWFLLANYCSQPVPGHLEIQQWLLRIASHQYDKSFLGSKQWIGSNELSWILDDQLGVTGKFISVNSGADLPTKAREIAAHFTKNGSPIMIGGGVLAYTLIGIDWNESTGAIKFLILDPHYTGGEDIGLIQKKGWIGWKEASLFRSEAFYNLMCPQRPQTI